MVLSATKKIHLNNKSIIVYNNHLLLPFFKFIYLMKSGVFQEIIDTGYKTRWTNTFQAQI